MPSKSEKQKRKKIFQKLQHQQLAEAIVAMPLKRAELKAMFDWVDQKLLEAGCDHTLRYSEAFLQARHLPIEEITNWLQEYGGYCDCEVIANVEDKWGEIVGSI